MATDRHYTPGLASVADLKAHLNRMGLQRAVFLQPSVYVTDNGFQIESLAQLEGSARGVAVIDEGIDGVALCALLAAGVRGYGSTTKAAAPTMSARWSWCCSAGPQGFADAPGACRFMPASTLSPRQRPGCRTSCFHWYSTISP